jgi:hypothetical protein
VSKGVQDYYDLHVPIYESYVAEGIISHNTAKSNALVDWLGMSAVYYPGAQILFARANLTDLKASTLMTLKRRWGATFDSENNVEAVYRFPVMACPMTGEPRQSEIRCIGLDRVDLESVLRSREFFRVGLEEGNQTQEAVHDNTLARCRQEVYHIELTNRDWLIRESRKWGLTLTEAIELLQWDEAHLNLPMKGLIGQRTIFNPDPNDYLWKRFTGVSYPDPAPTPEWVEKNIGVRRVTVDPDTVRGRGYIYQLGDMVRDPYGGTNYVMAENEAEKKVALIKPIMVDNPDTGMIEPTRIVPKAALSLIVERYSIYAFQSENRSGNTDNTKASFLMGKDLAERHFEGKFNARVGRVFPMFDRDIHVLPTPRDVLERVRRMNGIAGVDQGGDHATAAVFDAMLKTGQGVQFSEYVRGGESATTSAHNMLALIPPGMRMNWFCDPAMGNIQYATNDLKSPRDRYVEAGIPLQSAPQAGDNALETLMRQLEVKNALLDAEPLPDLLIFDCCEETIEMFEKLEWRDLLTRRYKSIVDIADARKFASCSRVKIRQGAAQPIELDSASAEWDQSTPRNPLNEAFRNDPFPGTQDAMGRYINTLAGIAAPTLDAQPGMSEWNRQRGLGQDYQRPQQGTPLWTPDYDEW